MTPTPAFLGRPWRMPSSVKPANGYANGYLPPGGDGSANPKARNSAPWGLRRLPSAAWRPPGRVQKGDPVSVTGRRHARTFRGATGKNGRAGTCIAECPGMREGGEAESGDQSSAIPVPVAPGDEISVLRGPGSKGAHPGKWALPCPFRRCRVVPGRGAVASDRRALMGASGGVLVLPGSDSRGL